MHLDNCILDEAHGVCRKEAPAYTWRDYRCVLEGRGGEAQVMASLRLGGK